MSSVFEWFETQTKYCCFRCKWYYEEGEEECWDYCEEGTLEEPCDFDTYCKCANCLEYIDIY